MMRLRASATVSTPSASELASRAARIRPGTALNLLVGKKPGSVVDWTASGASSLKSSLSLVSGVVSLAFVPDDQFRWDGEDFGDEYEEEDEDAEEDEEDEESDEDEEEDDQ